MKKTLLFLLLTATTMMYADEKNFMVMSDMHVMVNSLWDQNHPEVFYSDPKMVEHSHELFDLAVQRVIDNAPDFLLVPGVGAQGGSLEEVCRYGMNAQCGLIVNSSRAIIYADATEQFADVAGQKAREVQQQMAAFLR